MGLLRLEDVISQQDGAESPYVGAYCYIYAENSDRLAPLYADADLTVLKANPLIGDAEGIFDTCYLFDGTYRLEVRNASGVKLAPDETMTVRSVFSMSGGVIYETVPEVLNDTRMSYVTANGRVLVGAGDRLQVCGGGHSYEVVAASETKFDIMTPGNVKLRVTQEVGFIDVRAFGAVGDGIADDTAAIQSALAAASRYGGGAVLLPVGTWRITDTLVIQRSVSLVGRSHAGGQRGGGTANHPVTLKYDGTGIAIQLGSAGNPCVNAHVESFAIVAEETDANYRNFTAFEAYDLRSSKMQNLYVEGAAVGYRFTGEGGAVVYVATENLNAYDCGIGLETECPTALGEVWPFMQANTFGVREISHCETGIRLGGGQQNHSRIMINAGEIGGGGTGIHVDGDDDGNRLAYQLEGQGWFEKNTVGNIVMDAGTLYISGDITNSDNNVEGGYILNGGRLVPLGRVGFDDYSIPFTGFSTNGLVRAWSFVDMGTNNFYCPLSGAMAELQSGGIKTRANTRFGDGVQGDGAGGGLRVRNEGIDWTADWTLAMLVFTPSTADSEVFKVQKNSPLSRLELDARPGFVRVLMQDAGGTVETMDLGKTNDNPTRSPFWMVVSYDATLQQLQYRAPNGEVLETWNQPVPAALTSGNYDNFSLNGSLSLSNAVIDEMMIYNRVLTPDEVAGIIELRTNVVSTLGMDPRQGISRSGQFSGTTSGTGALTVPHGLLSTPKTALVQPVDTLGRTAHLLSIGATNITVEIRNNAGNPVGGAAMTVAWRAEL